MSEPVETVTLLLVDDEPRNLDALVAVLDDPSYRLLRAESANDALKLLLDNDVAAIVLDINMPGMSGFELAETIKATRRFREVPIVFLTAYLIDDQNVIAGYGAGAVDYLTKPINPQVLRLKVAVFADLFRKTRALADLNQTLEARVKERTLDLERSEAALRLADHQKDEFLAILAHELRNPLAPLSMGVELLMNHLPSGGSSAVTSTLARMKRQIDRMVRLIDDLLDISRITGGSMDLKKQRVDLSVVIRAAMESAAPSIERHGHVIAVDAPAPVFAVVDEMRIAQILGNLLNNSSKFTPNGSVIKIELAEEGDEAVIRVIDKGVGIVPDQIERVFEMFVRVERTRPMGQQGLGIGLALARRLAALHGGSLTASSAGEGLGTTFTLRLPTAAVAASDDAAVAVDVPAPGPTASLRVLVIEDNPDVADTLALWLEDQGHTVSTAGTGPIGINHIVTERPDVVLCDVGLPGMDGIEVCRRVRGMQLPRQPKMIALTGWGRVDDRRRTTEAGFDNHLVKPVAVETLRSVLRSVIATILKK